MAMNLSFLCVKLTGPSEWMTVSFLFSAIIFLSDLSLEPPKSQHRPVGSVLLCNSFWFSTYFHCIIILASHNTKWRWGERVLMNFLSSPKQNLLVCSVLPYCITLYDKYFHSVSLFIYQVLPLSASLRQGPDLSGVHVKLLQPCPTLCDPMDCSPEAPLAMGFSRQE